MRIRKAAKSAVRVKGKKSEIHTEHMAFLPLLSMSVLPMRLTMSFTRTPCLTTVSGNAWQLLNAEGLSTPSEDVRFG